MKRTLCMHLLAGAVSGVAVETVLFPLDTLKTRLQSQAGLHASGNYRSLYAGLSPVLFGAAPSAALFFVSYEAVKRSLRQLLPKSQESSPFLFMAAASLGEIAACSFRVPAEVLKQRMQVLQLRVGLRQAAGQLYRQEGTLGFYRGFQATIQREIPFACLQYPMYEWLKKRQFGEEEHSLLSGALCGAISGAFAGFLTTPLDLIKTRTILARTRAEQPHGNPLRAMLEVVRGEGGGRLFAGALPRTTWIGLGGLIFFGAYEKSLDLADRLTRPPPNL